ncbi:MAG TPA: [cytidine(C)-cytidine(C)-adenosine (A)]-adding enzyme [Leptospiraceae bacterium]|nr:[cytidine(C)-cytidine(C)-adenosine (A)]-adding enzyme [Leptospiraceae bacterium]
MLNVTRLIDSIPLNFKKDLEFISKQIHDLGKESFLIGGSVRDLILGKKPHEYDLTTSMLPEEIKKKFKRVIETGIQHGTVTIMLGDNAYEITTYRKDIDYTDGRRPDKIEFGASLSEDMKRRDFTMNAIALDLITERLIDENHGIEDIEKRLIRTIGNPLDRFGEDGLRPIRAIRFQSTLDFTIEPETYNAIYQTRHITEKISRERFHDELNKVLTSNNPFIGLIELHKNKIFELFTKVNFHSNPSDVDLQSLGKLAVAPLGLRLAYLLNWLLPKKDLLIQAEQILKDFRYSKANTKDALFYLDLFLCNYKAEAMNSIETRKFLSKVVAYTGIRQMEIILEGMLSYLEMLSEKNSFEQFKETISSILNSNNPLVLKELAVNGNQIIGKFPLLDKRKLGVILQSTLNRVLENPDENEEEKIYTYIGKTMLDTNTV